MRNPRSLAALVIGGWTAMGLFFGLRNFANFAYAGTPMAFSEAIAQGLVEAGTWAAITPFVIWLSARFRLERGRWMRRLPIHLIAAVVFGQLHMMLFGAAAAALPWVPRRDPVGAEFLQNALTYLAIVAVSHGLHVYAEAREREAHESRLQTQLTEARLGLLQAQLQPHFLFNAMHAVSELMHEDVERAETMITDLSSLLRMSLDNTGVQEVDLAEEMSFVEHYLDVEKTRFEDRLAVEIDVPPDLLGARVPYLALQPLVENALQHAVAKQRGPSLVRIRARRDDDMLRVEVLDSGPGDGPPGDGDPGDGGARQRKTAGAVASLGNGVGLRNTRARLRELYGDRQSLNLEKTADGACATLEVPLVFEARHAD